MIRLGTVGTSNICRQFTEGVKLSGKYELAAVYSRNRDNGEKFAAGIGAEEVFTDLYKMADSGKIDAVYIATPNVFHKEQCRIFLDRGIHVICEKPVVTCPRQLEELHGLAQKNGLVFMEAIIPRHVRQYRAVKDAVAGIGEIQMAKIDFCQRSSRLDSFMAGNHANIFDMSLHAGALMDIGVYCVYAALDLLGEPLSLKADCSFLYNGADGAGSAILNYGGFLAVLTYGKTCDSAGASEIIGAEGILKIGKISQYTGVTLIKDGCDIEIAGQMSKEELMSGEAEKFADYILNMDRFSEDYAAAAELCRRVHNTMAKIKQSAGIIYPAE